jgi:beta-mannosidase
VAQTSSNSIDLAGTWSLKDANGDYACNMPIPGDVHSALLAAGLIPDPYVGRNELEVRGLADRDWVATRTFVREGKGGGPYWYLDVDFLDTIAEVRINGLVALHAKNCFRRYRMGELYNALTPGENKIEILFKSNTKTATELAK